VKKGSYLSILIVILKDNMSSKGESLSYYDYEKLLERAYANLPKKAFLERKERFRVPPPEVLISGKRTFITNFKHIADMLNREPRLLLRYLLKELAAPGELTEDSAVIQGEIAPRTIASLLNRFVKSYVICPVCRSPDTLLIKERKIMYLKCMACGATSPVRPF